MLIINLSDGEKRLCESWQHSDKVSSNIAKRARIVLLLAGNNSVSETARILGLSRENVYKWLYRYKAGDYKWYVDRSRCPQNNPLKTPNEIEEIIKFVSKGLKASGLQCGSRSIKYELEKLHITDIPSISTIHRILKRHDLYCDNSKINNKKAEPSGNKHQTNNRRRFRIYKKGKKTAWPVNLSMHEKKTLESWSRSTKIQSGLAKRSEIILLADAENPISEIAGILNVSRQMAYKWIKRFQKERLNGLCRRKPDITNKYDDESVKSGVFSLLHSPPSDHNINRTSWKLNDLKKCLSEIGIPLSKGYIRKIIKSAGYSWRKARVVLTSPDPDYQIKLKKSNLFFLN